MKLHEQDQVYVELLLKIERKEVCYKKAVLLEMTSLILKNTKVRDIPLRVECPKDSQSLYIVQLWVSMLVPIY